MGRLHAGRGEAGLLQRIVENLSRKGFFNPIKHALYGFLQDRAFFRQAGAALIAIKQGSLRPFFQIQDRLRRGRLRQMDRRSSPAEVLALCDGVEHAQMPEAWNAVHVGHVRLKFVSSSWLKSYEIASVSDWPETAELTNVLPKVTTVGGAFRAVHHEYTGGNDEVCAGLVRRAVASHRHDCAMHKGRFGPWLND